MENNKKTGRIVGILFLLLVGIGAPGASLRGLSSALLTSPDFLEVIFEKSSEMRVSIFLDILATAVGVIIAIYLYPFLRRYHKALALAYLVAWVVQFATVLVSDINHLTLLSLSQDYVENNVRDMNYYRSTGLALLKGYVWAHLLSLIIFSTGGVLLYSQLLRAKLLPAIILIWGIIAVSLVHVATWAQVFGYTVSFNWYMQNGVHILVFTGWLLIRGFNQSEPANEDSV